MAQRERSDGFDTRAGSNFNIQSGEFDPEYIAQQIYPILEFRDKVVKVINITIEKVFPLILFFLLGVWLMVDSWSSTTCSENY